MPRPSITARPGSRLYGPQLNAALDWLEANGGSGSEGPQGETGPQGPTGPQGATGPAGPGGLRIGFHGDATANVTLTNQASTDQFLANSNRNIQSGDLAQFTQVRLSARVVTGSASANNPRVILRYSNSFTTTVGSFSDIGTSEVSASMASTGIATSGWINLAAGAIGDGKFLAVIQTGGDAAADPALGPVWADFK